MHDGGGARDRSVAALPKIIKGLRAKVGADRIRTVHGVGYALETGDAT